MIFIHIHVYHVMTHPNLTIILSAIIYAEEREVPFIFFTKQMFEKVFLCLKVITEFKDYPSINNLHSKVFVVKLRLPAP